MAKQVTLNLKSLDNLVAEMTTIKDQITAHAGNQATRLAAAREAVGDVEVKLGANRVPAKLTYSEAVQHAESILALANQIRDEAVTAHLRKQKDETTGDLSALRESFKAKAEAATAMQSVLVAMQVEGASTVAIPTLKGTGRVGTGNGTASANTKGQQFYRVVSGKRIDSPTSQNKFSSLAWYYGAAIGAPADTNNGKGCSAKALETYLSSQGVDVTAGSPWTFKVSEDFLVGMDVTATEEAGDEAGGDSTD